MSPEPPLDAAGIARRRFPTARRGYDPAEVQAFLQEIAGVVETLQRSVAAAQERADRAEARADKAEQLDQQRLVELLGEETARVLDAARTAAADIRGKAEQSAARMIREAQATAHGIVEEAEAEAAGRKDELLAEVEALRREAEAEVERTRAEAEAEADAVRAAAVEQGRRLIADARAVREELLGDLARRRRAAREQVELLNAARERLLAAYEVVRRTAEEAVTELTVALPEAKAASDLALRRVQEEPEPTAHELEAELTVTRMSAFMGAARARELLGDGQAGPSGKVPAIEARGAGGSTGRGRPTGDGGPDGAIEAPEVSEVADAAAGAGEAGPVEARGAGGSTGQGRPTGDGGPDGAIEAPEVSEVADAAAGAGEAGPVEAPASAGSPDGRASVARAGTAATEMPDTGATGLPSGEAAASAGPGETVAPDREAPSPGRPGKPAAPDGEAPSPAGSGETAAPDGGSGRRGRVDELFARIRAERGLPEAVGAAAHTAGSDSDRAGPVADDSPEAGGSAGGQLPVVAGSVAVDASPIAAGPADPEAPAGRAGPALSEASPGLTDPPRPEDPPGPAGPSRSEVERLLARDVALAEPERELSRQLKRVLADEQNEVFDRLRRADAASPVDLLPPRAAQVDRYARAGVGALDAAARLGADDVGGGSPGRCTKLATEMGDALVEPLRERVERILRESAGDLEEVTERLRALYREWKSQRINSLVRHYTAAAFAQGVYKAAPSGAELVWLVDRTGEPCPDADDNALAGRVCKGQLFPTGHRHAPAHPGCRCLVVPAD